MDPEYTDTELDDLKDYHNWLFELEYAVNAEAVDERAAEREWQSRDTFPEHGSDEIFW